MNIQSAVNRFLDFILNDSKTNPDLGDLIEELDRLACSAYVPEFEYDDNEYEEPPERNYSEIRETISRKFPTIGLYRTVNFDVSNIENTEVLTGDAVDDLTDIVGDLLEVKWYFENTTESNALWHLQFDYRSHWGLHLRELQLNLHKLWW